jgi:glycosyltransferase involved in cell wall biosynthesis
MTKELDKKDTKKILCFMDFMCPTGFGTVAHNILDRLTPWFKKMNIEVDVCALNYADNPHTKYNEQIMVLNPKFFARNKEDYYWRDGILKVLQIGDYDLFFPMNDIPVISPMGRHLQALKEDKIFKNKKPFKTLFYTPIDSQPYKRYFKDLEFFDTIVTYTEYGKKEILDAYRVVTPNKKINVQIINHGIDRKNFRPLNKKSELRKKYNLPQDAFVFGNVNKNQPRKDIGTTLIAFKYFKDWLIENHPNEKSVLYLHCYHSDKTGINLYVALERLGLVIGDDVILPIEDKYISNKYTTEEMNEVFNCLDVFVNTTMAEGWGLTIVEAMGVGLPIICGLHTSINEITDFGKLVYGVTDMVEHFQISDAENVRFKLNPIAVKDQMVKTFENRNKPFSLNKYKHKFEEYDWDKIAEEFKQQIKKLIL